MAMVGEKNLEEEEEGMALLLALPASRETVSLAKAFVTAWGKYGSG